MNENTGPEPTTDKSDQGGSPLTIKEIARLTGVSIGTVDRVLHNRGRVSAENTAKIQTLVADRGYKPNMFASRLSGGTTVRTLGVVMPGADQDFGYWRLIVGGMEKAAKELEPLKLEVQFETFDRQSPDDLARAFAAVADLPGLALAPIHARVLRPLVEALEPERPLVFFDTDMACTKDHCFAGQDPWQGGVLAARLLDLALPAGRPVVLVRFDEDDEHLLARSRGFEEASRHADRPVLVLAQTLSAPLDRRLDETQAVLDARPAAGGLFVPNASAGEYARVAGGRKGIGYDLIPANQTALRDGQLTVVLSQRPEVMGYEAILRLGRALLFHEELPKRISLPLDVILKENLTGHLEWSANPHSESS